MQIDWATSRAQTNGESHTDSSKGIKIEFGSCLNNAVSTEPQSLPVLPQGRPSLSVHDFEPYPSTKSTISILTLKYFEDL